MAHINLYLDNPHRVSVSHLFSSIGITVNAADADTCCGQSLNLV